MTFSGPLLIVRLVGYDGKIITGVAVPTRPHLPRLVLWSNRYFFRHAEADYYSEVACYLVPVENMYRDPAESRGLPFRKAER